MTTAFVTRISVWVALTVGVIGCTADDDPVGGGGSGNGGEATGGSPTTTSSSTTGGSGGTAPDTVCGDGVREGDEACDGADLGAATCDSIGLGPGELSCASGCGLVTAGCAAAEICSDHLDNNLDGLIDCGDPDCAATAECASGCAQAQPIFVSDKPIGDFEFHGSTVGKPSGLEPSCAVDSGAEQVVTFVAPATGKYFLVVGRWGSNADFSLSVRTDCDDAGSEVACLDRPNVFGASATEQLVIDTVEGESYYIVVDTRAASTEALFMLYVAPVLPETVLAEADACGDGVDNDQNGDSDCHDVACAAGADCVPGLLPFGAECTLATECAAASGNPVCAGSFLAGAAGYCSQLCDLAAPDCGPGNLCSPLGTGEGICLDGCTTDTDCLPGWGCKEAGAAVKLCAKLESDCNAGSYDNDLDGLEDCLDPDCQGTPTCEAGTKVAGDVCTDHSECAATGGDPWCLNGNCTEQCDPTDSTSCGPDALCIGHTFLGFLCYHKCEASPDCPDPDDGYCVELPPGYGYGGVCNLAG